MKTVDIRKVYVGKILKQTKVKKERSVEPMTGNQGFSYSWDFEKGFSRDAFFLRVLGGYKDLSTGKIYPKTTRFTGGKLVVDPEKMTSFIDAHNKTCYKLVKRYTSFLIDVDALKHELTAISSQDITMS